MVVKFGSEPDEVFFMEAVSSGVLLKRYSGMKHTIGDFYDKICLRHLEWSRPDQSFDILDSFIEEALKCSYQINLNKLRKR